MAEEPEDLEPWPLWDNPYRPGKIHPRPSRDASKPPRAVLRVFGNDYALGGAFEERYKAEAKKRGRQIVREIETGKRPHPGRRQSASFVAAPQVPTSPMTFARAQREFTEAKLRISAADADDAIKIRRHRVKVRHFMDMWRAVFPEDRILTNATLREAVAAWAERPIGAARRINPDTDMREPVLLTKDSTRLYTGRLKIFIEFCIASEWVTVNPLHRSQPIAQKKAAPKIKSLEPATRRGFMREIALVARGHHILKPSIGPDTPLTADDIAQLPDFIRILGFSGMRIGEAATLRLAEYVTDPTRENVLYADAIVLSDTKNSHKHDDRVDARPIPFRYLRYLAAAIDRQREHGHRHDGYLFAWHHEASFTRIGAEIVKECFLLAGLEGRFDRYHIFRSLASAYYQGDLGWPRHLVAQLLGHSEAINQRNYEDEEDRVRMAIALVSKEIERHI